MNKQKLTTIFRWSLIPVPVTAYFIYYASTYIGPKVGLFISGFIFLIIIALSLVINFFFQKMGSKSFQLFETPNNEIANGISGKVKILKANYLNMRLNQYPLYEFKLLVSAPGKEPYEIFWKQVATPAIMMNLKEGAEYPATIDALNKNNLEIKEFKKFY